MTDSDFEINLENLMDSPGGRIILEIRTHVMHRLPILAGIFFLGLIGGYPLASYIVEWLVTDASLAPTDTSIAVLTPVEFIAIKMRFAAGFGILMASFMLIYDVVKIGLNSQSLRERVEEADLHIPRMNAKMIIVMLFIPLLAIAGLAYSYGLLLPLLLEYLANDAASAGLKTEWRLSAYLGFILNMTLASMLGFQTPLMTMVVLRSGLLSRADLTKWRRHIWFGATILGALFSPPDPLSLFLVAGPIVLLFELALILEMMMPKKKVGAVSQQ